MRVRPRGEQPVVVEARVDPVVPLLVERVHLSLDAEVVGAEGGELGGGRGDDRVDVCCGGGVSVDAAAVGVFVLAAFSVALPPFFLVLLLLLLPFMVVVVRSVR